MNGIAVKALSIFLAMATLGIWADEVTGREFSEIVRDLNKELAEAKVKVREIQAEHQTKYKEAPKAVLPDRKEALSKLKDLTKDLKDTSDPNLKKEKEAKVQDQVLKVAELSADFLEYNKDELKNQDRQLEVMEDALAKVILKLNRLTELAAKDSMKSKEEIRLEKVQARRELQSMARVVEMMAKHNPSRHWSSVRQTIMLQDAVLKKTMADNSKLHKMLAAQKQVYEQTHAQIVLARQGIAEEKKLLAQIALGEVARSMLRKAAGLLLGNYNIEKVGMTALKQSEDRQKGLLDFLAQDQDADPAFNIGTDEESIGNEELPEGYSDFLNSEIN